MFCCRPGTRASSRVRSAAVGLLLLLTLGTAFASTAAEGTATAASGSADAAADAASFDRNSALSKTAEKAAALAQGLALRTEDADADAPPKPHRSLQFSYVDFTDDTTSAPLSSGNPTPTCGSMTDCINGCHSRFYKVAGTGEWIDAFTCGTVSFAQRLYVWKGSSSVCTTFTCSGTFAARLGCCWVRRCASACAVVLSRSGDTAADTLGCGAASPAGAYATWKSEAGAEYYVQVVGDTLLDNGSYTLTIEGFGDMIVEPANNGEYPANQEGR
jgi:hypothetical protein